MQDGLVAEKHIAIERDPMEITTPPQSKLWKWEDLDLTSSISWQK